MKQFLLLFLISLPCCARAQNIEGQIVASQFGEFKVQSEGNGFAFDPANCNVSGGGRNFPAFATGTPVKIVDTNPEQTEIAIPVGASINGSYCTVSLVTLYTHTSFYLTSGTGGLQEAITNSKVFAGGPNTIILNAEWYQLVSPGNAATVIASVTGGSAFGLVDVTTTPYSYYQWNGSQYVPVSAGAGGASFPSSPGIVYNTNVSSATNASSSQIAAALNTSPSTQLAPGLLPMATNGSLGVVKPDNSTITVTGGVLSSTGTLPAATGAGQVPTSTGAGTSYAAQTPSTLPPASGPGLVPVSTGAGTAYTAAQVPLTNATADQYVIQPLDNSSFTTLRVNSFNKVFYVDGFNSYGGIGIAPIAWSSGTNQPECQVVSYSGSYYIAINQTNNTTTPGASYGVWYPVPNNAAATNADCAWYMAVSYMRQNHQSALVQFGSGQYTTNQSFINPVDGSSYDDEFSVSAKGCGDRCTYLTYAGPSAIPVFSRPTGGANFTTTTISDMTIDGGASASAILELGSTGQSYFSNLSVGHVAPGSDHVLEFGHFGGDAFQNFVSNVNIGVYPDSGTQNCGTFTANVAGGSITSYTVNSGGNCYATYPGSTELTVVSLRGYKGGTAIQPCTVMPVGMVATIAGSAVTAISEGTNSGGSGCSGTIDVQVYQTPNVNYGAIFNNSDSTVKDVVSYDGNIAAFYVVGGDDTFIHLHPSVVPNGIIDAVGAGHFEGTEIDDVGGYGFQIQEPFTGEGTSIVGTNGYVGGNRFLNGSAMFYFAAATSATDPVTIGTTGSLCSATPGGGSAPPDWQEFVTQSGTVNSPSDYTAKAPVGLSVLGNDTSCGQAMGDYDPKLSIGNLGTVTTTQITTAQLGTVYQVDGFTPALYPGIGVAQTAWSSGTYPLCAAVSYSGSNYLAVGTATTTAPGTNSAIWWPVGNANTPTQTDCAFYYTLAKATAAGSSYNLVFGNSTYSSPYTTAICLAEPSLQTQVNLIGAGRGFNNQLTTLKATTSCNNGWVISAPDKTGSLPYNLVISGISIDAGGQALGCLQIYGEKVGYIEHIGCSNWNPTSGSAIPIAIGDGSAPYNSGGYQFNVNDIFVAGNASAISNRAVIVPTVVSGSPSFSITSGGSYTNIPSRAWVWGFGQGAKPCTTMGTLSTTYTGSGPYVLTGITASGFSGCTGTLYAYVPDTSAASYGMAISLMTDSTFKDLVVANAGWEFGIFWNGSSSNQMTHEHVYGDSQTQILDGSDNDHEATEIDTPADIGVTSGANTLWTDTDIVYGAIKPGVTGFYFPNSNTGNILQSTCGNTTTSSNLFNLVVTAAGPIPHGGNFGNVNVVNGQECDTLVRENPISVANVGTNMIDINTLTCGITVTDGNVHTVGTAPAGSCFNGVTTLAGLAAITINGTTPFSWLTDTGSFTGPLCTSGGTTNCFTTSGGYYALTNANVAAMDIGWLAAESILLNKGHLYVPGPVVLGNTLNLTLMLPMAGDDPGQVTGQPFLITCAGPKIAGFVAGHDFGSGDALITAGDPEGTAGNSLGRYSGNTNSGLIENCGVQSSNPNSGAFHTAPVNMNGINGGARVNTNNVEVRYFNFGYGLVGDHQLHIRLHLLGNYGGLYIQTPNSVDFGDLMFQDLKAESSWSGIEVANSTSLFGTFNGETYLSAPVGIYGESGGCSPIIGAAIFDTFDTEYTMLAEIWDGSNFNGTTYNDNNKCRSVNSLRIRLLHNNFLTVDDTAAAALNMYRRALWDVAQINDSVVTFNASSGSMSPNYAATCYACAPGAITNTHAVSSINAYSLGGTTSDFDKFTGDIGDWIGQLGTLPMINDNINAGNMMTLEEPGLWSGRLQQVEPVGSYTTTTANDVMEYSNGNAVAGGYSVANDAFAGVIKQTGLSLPNYAPLAKSGLVNATTGYVGFNTTFFTISTGVGKLSFTAGSGGATGTYPLLFSGGCGTEPGGTFTVAGGVISSMTLTSNGLNCTSAPTVTLGGSSGITGSTQSVAWPSAQMQQANLGSPGAYVGSYNAEAGNGGSTTAGTWYNGIDLSTNGPPPNLAAYAPLASPAFTGTATAPTQAVSTNNTDIATTAAVTTALSSYAPLASPAFSGTPKAPAFFPQTVSAGPAFNYFDDFITGANNAANNIGSPTSASCAVNTTYADINHPGQILLTSGTGGSGTGITCGTQSEFGSFISPNSSSSGWTWETAVYVPVLPATTAGAFQAGLSSSPNANPWTGGIEFYLSSANSVANDWYCRFSSTSTDSTVAATAATWTRLTMVNDGTYVHWYINGAEATGCKTAVGSMPSSAQYPASWSAVGLSSTSVTMAVDYVAVQRPVSR